MVKFDPPLDVGIECEVMVLRGAGVETFESCEGGPGHAYPEPTIRFHGSRAEGYRATAVVLDAGLSVSELRRVWPVIEGDLTGPWWELTFTRVVADAPELLKRTLCKGACRRPPRADSLAQYYCRCCTLCRCDGRRS